MHYASPSSWRPLWSLQQSAWTLWCQQFRLLWVPHLCRHIWRLLGYFACLLGYSAWYLLSVIGGCVCPHSSCWLRHLVTPGQAPAVTASFHSCPVPSVSDTTDAQPTWAVVPSCSCWPSKHVCTQRREPPHPRRVWSFTERQTVLKRCRTELHKHITSNRLKSHPSLLWSFLIFGSSPQHSITSLVQLQMLFSDWSTRLMVLLGQSCVLFCL